MALFAKLRDYIIPKSTTGKSTKNNNNLQLWASRNSSRGGKYPVSDDFLCFLGRRGSEAPTWAPSGQHHAHSMLLLSVCWLKSWARKPAGFASGELAEIVIYGWRTKPCLEPSLKRTACRILNCMISLKKTFCSSYEIEHRKRKVHKTYVDNLVNKYKANTRNHRPGEETEYYHHHQPHGSLLSRGNSLFYLA